MFTRRFARSLVGLLPGIWQRNLFDYYLAGRSPDRVFLVRKMLPVFASRGGSLLWVGCRAYTRSYPNLLERKGGQCWTLDVEPEAARWGHGGRHVVGSILDAPRLFPNRL